jgi:hypothetical protein
MAEQSIIDRTFCEVIANDPCKNEARELLKLFGVIIAPFASLRIPLSSQTSSSEHT